MEDVTIKVSTRDLLAAAENAERAIGKVETDFSAILDCVTRSPNYWEGAGNEAYVRKMRSRLERTKEVLARFREDAGNLKAMAGTYDQANQDAFEYTQSLSADVIV